MKEEKDRFVLSGNITFKAEIELRHIDDPRFKRLRPELARWLKEKGFEYFLGTWHGFGLARTKAGVWYEIDVRNRRIENKIENIKDTMFYLFMTEQKFYQTPIDVRGKLYDLTKFVKKR
ncbi:MAG: hypothetical protein Q6363_004130 [Candidatus Njordarchaeota archaeon]